jgi:hypothetical protein
MHLSAIVSAIIGFSASISAGAVPSGPKPALDPLNLKCLLRERQFFTEILFTRNSNGVLVGEMDHYISTGQHGRRFLSGNIFFDIRSDERQIEGNTGDPRGIIIPFVLKPSKATQLNGRWIYVQTDASGKKTEVALRCVYPET